MLTQQNRTVIKFFLSVIMLAGFVASIIYITGLVFRSGDREDFILLAASLSGAFGGILFALNDRMLELPHIEDANRINFGFLSDCAFGMAGGFVVFLIIPFNNDINSANQIEMVKFLAVTLIGGYAGRALVEKYSTEFESRIGKVEQEVQVQKELQKNDAWVLESVGAWLEGEKDGHKFTIEELKDGLAKSSPVVKANAFILAQRQRSAYWTQSDKKDIMCRTIPIFEALIADDKDGKMHRNYGQLGYVFKDNNPPDLMKAFDNLSKAIYIRDNNGEANTYLYYEMNRALVLIRMWEQHMLEAAKLSDKAETMIMADLKKCLSSVRCRDILSQNEHLKRYLDSKSLTLEQL